MKTKLRTYGKKLMLSLASLLVALLVCEAALQLADYNYTPLKIEVRAGVNDWRVHHSFRDEHFTYDPQLLWRPRKSNYIFNSQGFRGKELAAEKKANEIRIFAVGDSNTLGWDDNPTDKINNAANWPEFLEECLASPGREVTVVNAGVYGYSSFQGVLRFKQTLPFKPDLVLISFGGNDPHRVSIPDAEFTAQVFHSPLFRTKTGQLVVATWNRLLVPREEVKEEDLVARVSVKQYRKNLAEIIRISKANNIQCVLLTRPFMGASESAVWWKNFAPPYVDATLEVGRECGVPVIDIHKIFKDREGLFADESHFTEAGHRFAAETICRRIRPLLLP